MPTNQWGPYYPGTNGGNVPTPAGVQNPPQSPSGSVTNAAATYNFAHGIQSTAEALNGIGVNVAQQGTPAISNVASVAKSFAGQDPATVAVNNYTAGSVGTVGTKFS